MHADLSEYNILYHNSHLYIIDVSQSVEHDHPSAFDFLRNDIKNVEDFFSKMGVNCLGLRRSFEFIVKENLDSTNETSDEDSKSNTDSEAGEGNSRLFEDKRPRGHRHEDRELKKVRPPFLYMRHCLIPAQERKKATKTEQREKRKSKMPKAEKKRRIKASR